MLRIVSRSYPSVVVDDIVYIVRPFTLMENGVIRHRVYATYRHALADPRAIAISSLYSDERELLKAYRGGFVLCEGDMPRRIGEELVKGRLAQSSTSCKNCNGILFSASTDAYCSQACEQVAARPAARDVKQWKDERISPESAKDERQDDGQAASPTKSCPFRIPINRDAASILRPLPHEEIPAEWTPEDIESVRWKGLISECPFCAGRGYEGGYCFGCGTRLRAGEGRRHASRMRKRPNK